MNPLKAAIRAAIQAYKRQAQVNKVAKDLELPILSGTTSTSTGTTMTLLYPKKGN